MTQPADKVDYRKYLDPRTLAKIQALDIRAVAYPTLRHRILTNFNAEAEGIRPDDIVKMLIEQTPRDAEDDKTAASLPKVFSQSK